MSTTHHTNWFRKVAASAVLAATPAIIAFADAGIGHADPLTSDPGPSLPAPEHHRAFPYQQNLPEPGTSLHHHHYKR
jgi:hypothetical protein